MVKREPNEEEEQDTKTSQTYNNTQRKLKKLSKQMGDLAHEALVHRTKLPERFDQGKIYLQPLLELLMQQVATFHEATNTAIGHNATGGEQTLAAVGVLEKQLQEANTHYKACKYLEVREPFGQPSWRICVL